MKIVHAVHSFPPATHGGTETYVEMLARAQAGRGHRVHVVSGREGDANGQDVSVDTLDGAPPLEVIRLPPPVRSVDCGVRGASLEGERHLAAILARLAPDVLHLHHWHNVTHRAVRAAAAAGVPAIVTLHDLYATCPLFFRLPPAAGAPCPPELERSVCSRCIADVGNVPVTTTRPLLDRRDVDFREELARAAAVLLLSPEQRAFLSAVPLLRGIDLRVVPLPPPPWSTAIAHAPPEHEDVDGDDDGEPGRLRVVTWGGLVRGKGLHTLVDACELLSAPHAVSIAHHGRVLDAAYRDELLAGARRVALSFHGPFDRDERAPLLARHDVAVFPSLYLETHGYAVDEALDLGLPVVVSDRGAPGGRVGGRGRTFPAGDARALAEVLEDLRRSPARRSEMRAATRPPQPTLEEHVRACEEIYAEVVAR